MHGLPLIIHLPPSLPLHSLPPCHSSPFCTPPCSTVSHSCQSSSSQFFLGQTTTLCPPAAHYYSPCLALPNCSLQHFVARVVVMFFVLQDMALVRHTYQFSLRWFTTLFREGLATCPRSNTGK